MSGTQNPEALPKHQWVALKGSGSEDGVTHVIYDPHDSSPTPGPSRSETWESYKQPIGSGGQGVVFLQGCTAGSRVGQCRALKVIQCREAKRQRQYLREIEAMAKFSDERLPEESKLFTKLFGYYLSIDRAGICIAMEYHPEGDVHSYIRLHGPLHEQHAQEVLGQALQALAMLHEAGFAHGNMKPQNVLIQQRPKPGQPQLWWVKLVDFGISQHIDTVMNPTDRLGSLDDCMAPDLLSLLEHQVQPTKVDLMGADMWALGAMAFFVLTAKEGGFKEWVSVARDADIRKPLPEDQLVGQDALSFILNKTAKAPVDRLGLDTIWLAQFTRPSASTEQNQKEKHVKDDDENSDLVTLVASWEDDSSSSSLAKDDTLAHLSAKEIRCSKGREAVYAACQDGDVEMLRGLINRGADVTSWDRLETRHPYTGNYRGGNVGTPTDWESPLLRAARHGQTSTVELLAESGVQTMRPVGVDGLLAVNEAARLGHSDVVTLLMDLGADPRAKDCFGHDALSCAARGGHLDVVKLVLLSSMMQNSPLSDQTRAAAIDVATRHGHQDVVLYLVDMGSNIFTALHEAAARGRLDVVDSLVRVTPPAKRAMLLLQDVALTTEHWQVAAYLQSAMVDALTACGVAPSMVARPANESSRPLTVTKSRLLHGSPLDSARLNTDGRDVIRVGCPFWVGSTPALYFRAPWEGATVGGVVNPKYVRLNNESSSTLAAGGQLLISTSVNHEISSSRSLAIDLFQIASVDESGGDGKAYALHPHHPTSSDQSMLFYYSLCSQSAGLQGSERWVWEQVPPSRCQRRQVTAGDGSPTRQYLLYRSRIPIPALAGQPVRFGGAIILGRFLRKNGWFRCYARLQVSGGHQHNSKSSGRFRLDVMRPGGDDPQHQQEYLAIVITALAIWARYVEERLTARHVQGCWPWP